ncbi:MAG: hypothetical protein H8E85_03245, partial [Candidatus Marinimicrobia bacterium]|nr:hypothetical protein [Candidatus Neomarinimicrobiota bacterium]
MKKNIFLACLLSTFSLLVANSLSLADNGDGTFNVDYSSDTAIGGFQFNIDDATVNSASGGDATANGFFTSTSATTVLGFSLSGGTIPAGSGTLVVLDLTGTPSGLSGIVMSDSNGQALDFTFEMPDVEITGGCDLPDLNMFLAEDGSVWYNSSEEIGGFQFTIDGTTASSGSGGDAGDAGFMISVGGSTVLGFSLSGATFGPGCGTMVVLTLNGVATGLSGIVMSDPNGQAISFEYFEDGGTDPIYGCMDPGACNFDPEATVDDDSCWIAEEGFDCDGNCVVGEDCTGICGGTTEEDECGICDGNGSSCADCNGVPNGPGIEDNCGVCDPDPTNDCTQDCNGDWGGTAAEDECGICDGDNLSCADCNGVPNGSGMEDNCGVCDPDPSNDCEEDCNGDWGGSAEEDECGVCAGDGSSCSGENVPDWEDNPGAYEFTATISGGIVQNEGVQMGDDGDMFAAFDADGNVRGVAIQLFPPFGPYEGTPVYEMQMRSNAEGDLLHFKYYDASEDVVLDIVETYEFVINDILGDVINPIFFNIGTASGENAPDWVDNPGAYEFTATISGGVVLNESVQMGDDGDMFAAFDDAGNVRGVAIVLYPPFGPYEGTPVYEMQMRSNAEGDLLHFKYYDASEDVVLDIVETYEFVINDILGNVMEPVFFNIGSAAEECVDDDAAVAPLGCASAVAALGCDGMWGDTLISDACPVTCDACPSDCADDDSLVSPLDCASASAALGCDGMWGDILISDACPETCGECDTECDDVDADGVCDDVDDCVGAYDECNICNGDNSSCTDCAGVPNGDSWESDCGCVAAGNSGDDCDDCAGTPNGDAELDECGVCNGGNADDLGCGCFEPGPSGCDNECGSTLEDDECGVCGGDNSSCSDCAGAPNGDSWESDCGCVAGNNSGDDCDDCNGVPNGSAELDDCGICGGDGSTCAPPDAFAFNQSTQQAFYFFMTASVDGESLDGDDWIGAFRNGYCSNSVATTEEICLLIGADWNPEEICVGARKWGDCDSDECDVPAMGVDGSNYTVGYMTAGVIPIFKIYDASEGEYLNAIPSEEFPWATNGMFVADSLENAIVGCSDMYACNYDENANIEGECSYPEDNYDCDGNCIITTDCAGECGGSAELDDCGICEGGNADDLGCGCFEPGPSGCDNECGSTLEDDECGVCGGDNSTCEDCAGVPNGSAELDDCGICEGGNADDLGCGCFEP